MTQHRPVSNEPFEELARAIGEELAILLSERLGGTRQYVPIKMGEHHPLAVILGQEGAARLVAWAGGGSIDVPRRRIRKQQALSLLSRGALTIAQIAAQTTYTERHVYRLKKAERDHSQPSLFEDFT